MKKLLVLVVAALSVLSVLGFKMTGAPSTSSSPVTSSSIPAPTTAQGFTQMFEALDSQVWGAADLGISVPMADGRSVWLFGDTFSGRYGMVHSSALVQSGGSLHVSNEGMQLLPNPLEDKNLIYWIETARAVDASHLEVVAEQVRIGSGAAGGWDFHRDAVQDRTALVAVSPEGDVSFVRWTGWTADPKIDTRFLTAADGAPSSTGHDVYYARHAHPEFALTSGKTLTTIAHNWDAPQTDASGHIDFSAYRLVFSER